MVPWRRTLALPDLLHGYFLEESSDQAPWQYLSVAWINVLQWSPISVGLIWNPSCLLWAIMLFSFVYCSRINVCMSGCFHPHDMHHNIGKRLGCLCSGKHCMHGCCWEEFGCIICQEVFGSDYVLGAFLWWLCSLMPWFCWCWGWCRLTLNLRLIEWGV